MKDSGAVGFTDGYKTISNTRVMKTLVMQNLLMDNNSTC